MHSIYTTAATDAYQCLVNLYKDIEKLQKLKILNKSLNSTLMACHIGCKTLVLDNKNQLSIKDRINIIKLIPLGCINLTSNESSNFELSKELSRNDILLEMLQQQLPKELLALTDDSGKNAYKASSMKLKMLTH
ncbi:MAG: hypothetical protein HWD59_10315 [Coxiellaceae bacterium]|nr:MAG: hypothetical protein HWD59_10315 [Coxiellaceae bacterium]